MKVLTAAQVNYSFHILAVGRNGARGGSVYPHVIFQPRPTTSLAKSPPHNYFTLLRTHARGGLGSEARSIISYSHTKFQFHNLPVMCTKYPPIIMYCLGLFLTRATMLKNFNVTLQALLVNPTCLQSLRVWYCSVCELRCLTEYWRCRMSYMFIKYGSTLYMGIAMV